MKKGYLGEEEAFHYLNELNHHIEEKRKTFLGYPCNGAFHLEKFFKWWQKSWLSQSPMNEVGNPNSQTLYTLNARPYEMSVLEYFAHLYQLHPFWGYITTGGTQGNEQGLYMGRQALQPFGKPILYFSEEAHYSIKSLGKVLNLECCILKATASGEMDYVDLERKLDVLRPVLFSLSIGTTFKGGIDRIEIVDSMIKKKKIKHRFYHADAALFGGYLPFAHAPGKPDLNFKNFPYDSIAVSGHKFFGSPIPLGIFLIRKEYVSALKAEYIEYIHTKNLTLPCSRSALNTLIFWWIISTTPKKEFIHQTEMLLENASYLFRQLKIRNYPVWLNEYSNTVYFRAPSLNLTKRWCLSLYTCPHLGHLAHAIIMQHATKEIIDEFLSDLDRERAIKYSRMRRQKKPKLAR